MVAGLNADGTPKRTPAKAENAQSFLQFFDITDWLGEWESFEHYIDSSSAAISRHRKPPSGGAP